MKKLQHLWISKKNTTLMQNLVKETFYLSILNFPHVTGTIMTVPHPAANTHTFSGVVGAGSFWRYKGVPGAFEVFYSPSPFVVSSSLLYTTLLLAFCTTQLVSESPSLVHIVMRVFSYPAICQLAHCSFSLPFFTSFELFSMQVLVPAYSLRTQNSELRTQHLRTQSI